MRCSAVYSNFSSQWASATKTLIFLPFHLILAKRTCHFASFALGSLFKAWDCVTVYACSMLAM
jgi:hypothetical protein